MLYHTGFNELSSFNLLLAHLLIQSIFDLLRKKKSESKVIFLELSVVVISQKGMRIRRHSYASAIHSVSLISNHGVKVI
mgnify:CR=1 FL=1